MTRPVLSRIAEALTPPPARRCWCGQPACYLDLPAWNAERRVTVGVPLCRDHRPLFETLVIREAVYGPEEVKRAA